MSPPFIVACETETPLGSTFGVSKVSKSLPRQAEVAQGVPGRLRSRIFLTFRHYNCRRSSAKRTGRLYPRRNPWYSLSEAESTSGHMVLSGVQRKKSPVTPLRIDPGTSRLVAQCLNHCATHILNYFIKNKVLNMKKNRTFQHFVFQVMHTTLKNVELLKHFKIRKLLQHVSVYKETIIRDPQPVLS